MPKAPGAKPGCANILIAHQGGIPAYRIPFYDLLEKLRPDHWRFHVINDAPQKPDGRNERSQLYSFPVINAPVHKGPFNLKFQNFLSHARKADVLILDTHLSNIGYILAASARRRGSSLILWGHTHNMNRCQNGWRAKLSRYMKTRYLRSCDTFLAYTPGQSATAISMGLCTSKIRILNNTIDIEAHRSQFLRLIPQRHQLRQTLGFDESAKVLLMVGRLLTERRVNFLCDTFRQLAADHAYRLIVIGDGPTMPALQQLKKDLPGQVVASGAITDMEILSQYYAAADAFIMPGAVGLAPLEAMCYDLNVFAFHLPSHGPEFEYLTPANSIIFPQSTTPAQCASSMHQWFSRQPCTANSVPYETISHLRLETMVRSYIVALEEVLRTRGFQTGDSF